MNFLIKWKIIWLSECGQRGCNLRKAQWDDEVKQLFYGNYGDLPYLLDIKVDKHFF
ncbi:hypothetical protein Gotri_025312 [Gossypium trilobum]|uniref:Uncharacterized protein n=1 Tax=Gossypium trilobum TaxID=34281 RepID=A0A7J9FWC8_9ROSI|nr:hypothetical protein [Gossypium trilobum]